MVWVRLKGDGLIKFLFIFLFIEVIDSCLDHIRCRLLCQPMNRSCQKHFPQRLGHYHRLCRSQNRRCQSFLHIQSLNHLLSHCLNVLNPHLHHVHSNYLPHDYLQNSILHLKNNCSHLVNMFLGFRPSRWYLPIIH